jgi:hypothetical protein
VNKYQIEGNLEQKSTMGSPVLTGIFQVDQIKLQNYLSGLGAIGRDCYPTN